MIRKSPNERGQALILAVLCLAVLIALVGFAADIGFMFVAKRKMQVAADIASVAGAAEINYGDSSTAAQAAAAQNGFTNGVNGVTVTVNSSPAYGAYKGQAGYLEVIISQSEPTYFLKVLHLNSMAVNARAVATLSTTENCIFLLNSSGTDLLMNNAGKIVASSCGLLDNSSSSDAISVTDGASISVSTIGVVGSASTSGGTVTPAPSTGIVPFSDPLAYLAPPTYNASSCTADPQSYYGNGVSTYTVGPGSAHSTTQSGNLVCYTSLTLGDNGFKATLNPGIYVITGGLTFSGSGTTYGGTGVTFYLPGTSALNMANGAVFNLSAPTSGTYNGILFYQDRSNTQAASMQGGATSVLQGIVYLPSANLTMGNGSAFTYYSPVIAQTLTMYGGSTFTDDDYNTLNVGSPLTYPRLVE